MTKENYKLLVIEDTEEFVEAARASFARINKFMGKNKPAVPLFDVKHVPTFMDGIVALETEKFDGVASDLFMPASDSSIDRSAVCELMQEYSGWIRPVVESIVNNLSKSRVGLDGNPNKDEFWQTKADLISRVERGLELLSQDQYIGEFPHGLSIARYCAEREIPYTIISQGERHKGKLGDLHSALYGIDKSLGVPGMETSFLYHGSVPCLFDEPRDRGLKFSEHETRETVDKREPQVWADALFHVTSGLKKTVGYWENRISRIDLVE